MTKKNPNPRPENRALEAGRDQHGRFRPGTSGNPGGRSQRDREVSALLDIGGPRAIEIAMAMVEQGNLGAVQLIVKHAVAVPKAQTAAIDLGPLRTAADCGLAISRVAQALANGEVTPPDANSLMGVLKAAAEVIELNAVVAEVRELKAMVKDRAP